MRIKTARQIVSDATGIFTVNVAKSRHATPEHVKREAKTVLRETRQRERRRVKCGGGP
jgi:hypothetical protein